MIVSLILFFAVLYLTHAIFFKKSVNLPPGAYPFFGNKIEFGGDGHKTFEQWRQKFGDVFTIKLGVSNFVVLNTEKLIREAFNEPVFSGRPQEAIPLLVSRGPYGVINTEGAHWEAQRRFTLRHLRDFGFGKNVMEQLIMEEVKELIEWMKENENVPISLNRKFGLAVFNALWTVVAGTRFSQHDKRLKHLMDSMVEALANIVDNNVLIYAPWVRFIAPEWSGWNDLERKLDNVFSFLQNSIDEHEKSLPEDEPRDFIDHYLQEIRRTTDENSTFYGENGKKNLLSVSMDLFQGGSETTSTTLSWIILYLIAYPEIQKKIHAEIDSVIGSRSPTLADRPKCQYIEAFFLEIFRHVTMLPVGVFHRALADAKIAGYDIPKGTYLASNFYAVQHDKNTWGDPENFRPERFLDDNGIFHKHDCVMPFSVGRRQCLGETMGRDSLFLFFTSIFQRFSMTKDPDCEKIDFGSAKGFARTPKPFKVVLTDRFM